jgi:hypothetical protein
LRPASELATQSRFSVRPKVAAGQKIVGLERGRRRFGRLEALDDEIGDRAGAALVADEAHHMGGVVGRQAFEHAKFIQEKPNKTKKKSLVLTAKSGE